MGVVLILTSTATSILYVPMTGNRDLPSADRWHPLSRVQGLENRGSRSSVLLYDRVYAPVPHAVGGRMPDWKSLRLGPASIGYEVAGPGHALVIGGGGGRDIYNALAADQTVDVIELNSAIRDVVDDDLGHLSGAPYSRDGVSTSIGDGRAILANRDTTYDQIHIGFTDTLSANAAQGFALSENNLYTLEAFDEYLDHLSPTGILNVSRLEQLVGDEAIRVTVLTMAALEAHGVEDPARHMVVIRGVDPVGLHNFPYETVLARLTPFTDAELARIRQLADERAEGIAFMPGGIPRGLEGPGRGAQLAGVLRGLPAQRVPADRRQAVLLQHAACRRRLRHQHLPVHLRRRPLPAAAAHAGGAAGAVDRRAAAAAVAGPAPGTASAARAAGGGASDGRRRRPEVEIERPGLTSLLYFGAVGLGFMLLETVLIQRFVLFLGFPTYALSVVLFALLVFTGIGSALSARVPRTRRGLVTVLAVVVALVVVAAVALQPVLESLIALPFGARVAISVAVLAPVGLGLGMPMPLGLARFADLHPRSVAYAWGVNGMASVLASVLGVAIAINFGYRAACLVAAGFYALALAHAAAGRWAERAQVDDRGLEGPLGRPPMWPPSLSPSPSPSPGRRRARAGDVRWWVEDELVRSGYRRAPAPGPVPAPPPRRAPSRRSGAPDWPDPAPEGGRVPARAGWDAADRAVSVPPAPPPPPGRGARGVPVPPAPPPASPGRGPRPDGERGPSWLDLPPAPDRRSRNGHAPAPANGRASAPRPRPPPVRPRRRRASSTSRPAPAPAHLPRPVPQLALLLTPAIGHASTCASTALSDPGTRRSSYRRHRQPGGPVKYMMFVVADPDAAAEAEAEGTESEVTIDEWLAEVEGKRVTGDRLRPVDDATTVRVSKGEVLVSDGPFTESKDWIAGFDIIECADLDEAIAIAARHPQAYGGKLELRPFWPMDE